MLFYLLSSDSIFTSIRKYFQIWDGLIQHVVPSLSLHPLDVESLRCYLVLPLYHQFENPKNCDKVQSVFGKKVLGLKSDYSKIIGNSKP